MNALITAFVLAAIDIAGLVLIYFALRARLRRYLELENLLSGVRDEARALTVELNQAADRGVTLLEDRMDSLRALLAEIDRRVVVAKKEADSRESERAVFERLRRRKPLVTQSGDRAAAVGHAVAAPGTGEGLDDQSIFLPLGPGESETPSIRVAQEALIPEPSRREQALDLYRKGFSADIIAARLGVTVAEIELLVELEERRPVR